MNSKNVFLTNSFYKEHPNHLVCSLYSDINTKEVDVFWSYVQLDDGTQFGLIGQNVCPRWGHRRRSMPLFQPFKFRARF